MLICLQGTGDTQLTFAQEVKVDGAIIVSTPQDLALLDVKRGIQMFDKTGVKILGLIDNMSFFKGDDGKEYKIFGEGGVEKTAKEFNKEFLGHLPCLLYTSPSPRDQRGSRMPSSA